MPRIEATALAPPPSVVVGARLHVDQERERVRLLLSVPMAVRDWSVPAVRESHSLDVLGRDDSDEEVEYCSRTPNSSSVTVIDLTNDTEDDASSNLSTGTLHERDPEPSQRNVRARLWTQCSQVHAV